MIFFNVLSFIVVLSIIVFAHEFGHYLVARLNDVAVEEFAIGYGREIFGFNDKNGTRWKICIIPMGGFCKFFGDEEASSTIVDHEKMNKLTDAEKEKCLFFKTPFQRMQVVSAGPIFNYLLSFVLFAVFFNINGVNIFTNKIGRISDGSPADKADLRIGDVIKRINNKDIVNFNDIQEIIMNDTDKNALNFIIERDGQILEKNIVPVTVEEDGVKFNQIGIGSEAPIVEKVGFFRSFCLSAQEIWKITKNTMIVLGKMLMGKGGFSNISGPIRIAQYSGKAVKNGIMSAVYFTALISIGLGFMNLIPIPGLDGGHIFLNLLEMIRRKPLGEKTENVIVRLGLAFLFTLAVFVIIKDIIGILL